MTSLASVIADTLSPNADVRRNAENQLSEALKRPGHPLEVLHLIANENAAPPPVRQAAAVHFKNLVSKGWDESKDLEDRKGIVISEQDRNTIKTHLVELMCTVPPQIQAQVSAAISLIAEVDYPAKWENLLPDLVNRMKSPDINVVNGVLSTANSIFKRFRYVQRSDELYAVIIYTLKIIQEPLLSGMIQTVQAVEAAQNDPVRLKLLFESLLLMSRIFYSLNYQDLPEFFEDHMQDVMAVFSKFLKYQNPLLVDNDEEEEPSPVDRLQASIVDNLKLYADKDEEPFLPYLKEFAMLVWNLLVGLTPHPKHDALVTTSIKFLSSLIGKQMHRELFQSEETLKEIVSRIVIPNLMVREVDEEKFEDDPREFLLTEIEGSDSDSRRKCSRDLLNSMCNQFEDQTTAIVTSHINTMLAEFQADNTKWQPKDTAIHLMLGIAVRRESYQGVSEVNGKVDLMGFFQANIIPELQDGNHANRPMVKATALKFVWTFRNQFNSEQLASLMPLLISNLNSPNVVVHTLAAYGIERCLMAVEETGVGGGKRYKLSTEVFKPLLEPLFSGLFTIIDNPQLDVNEHVMKCNMRSMARAGENIIPVTGIFFGKLSAALERVCKNPQNPSYNHYLFESIAALVRNVCSKEPSKIGELEALLFPPFQGVLQQDITEFTPYVFQILAQLLEYRPQESGIGEAYTNLFPPLLTASLWESKGNVPGLVRLISAYEKKAAPMVIPQVVPILGIFQKLNASRSTEGPAIDLLCSTITYIPMDQLSQYMVMVFRLIMTKLNQRGVKGNNKYPGLAVKFFALLVGLHGSKAFFDYANGVQAGVALGMLSQMWIPNIKDSFATRQDAKIQVVGLTRLLFDTDMVALLDNDNGRSIWSAALEGVIAVLASPTLTSVERGGDEDDDVEIGYDSTYSQLSLATKKADDPFLGIADPMGSFAAALQALNSSKPGILVTLTGVNPKLTPGLQSVQQKSGVNLLGQ